MLLNLVWESTSDLEFFVDTSEKVISGVEGLSLVAREGELGVVTGEGLLVEDGLVTADEGELGGLDDLERKWKGSY